MLDEYLDAARAASSIKSDYELSKILGISRAHVSSIRRGVDLPSAELMLQLAELGKKSKEAALLHLAQARASSEEVRSIYAGMMRKIGISMLLLAMPFFSFSGSAQASFSQVNSVSAPMVKTHELRSIYYAPCDMALSWLRRVARLLGSFLR